MRRAIDEARRVLYPGVTFPAGGVTAVNATRAPLKRYKLDERERLAARERSRRHRARSKAATMRTTDATPLDMGMHDTFFFYLFAHKTDSILSYIPEETYKLYIQTDGPLIFK